MWGHNLLITDTKMGNSMNRTNLKMAQAISCCSGGNIGLSRILHFIPHIYVEFGGFAYVLLMHCGTWFAGGVPYTGGLAGR